MTQQSLPDVLATIEPVVMKRARRLSGTRAGAQDLCQDVMLSLWTRLRNGDQIHDLRAYAMTALTNRFNQRLRERRTILMIQEDMLVAEPVAFAQIALAELDKAIARLPREQALLIRLVAAGETSPSDLARRTGWPKGTVMSRLARARSKLRQEMHMSPESPVSSLI